jgi:hypothetical protein
MARSDSHTPGATALDCPCRHCGGSGILRRGDQQFRTCLDCLGQGRHPRMEVGQGLIGLIEGRWPNPLAAALNAGTSASASR